MGLDISVYINPRPADADELAAIGSDTQAALVALDLLESASRLPKDGWRFDALARHRNDMMRGGAAGERADMAELLELIIPYINPDFEARASDLEAEAYVADMAECDLHFTYGGYNRWREWLASIAGIEVPVHQRSDGRSSLNDWWSECAEIEARGDVPSTRFWQLLHFSDCEGVIGPAVCRSLADDFDAMADTAAQRIVQQNGLTPQEAKWLIDGYEGFRKAFRSAAETGGWVSFH